MCKHVSCKFGRHILGSGERACLIDLSLCAMQACRLPPASGPVATCLMSCLWTSCLTLKGLFQASALGREAQEGSAWLQSHCSGQLLLEAATMARIAAELYRLVDNQAQQVSISCGACVSDQGEERQLQLGAGSTTCETQGFLRLLQIHTSHSLYSVSKP